MKKIFNVVCLLLIFSNSFIFAVDISDCFIQGVGYSNLKNRTDRKQQGYLRALGDLMLNISGIKFFSNSELKLDYSAIKVDAVAEGLDENGNYCIRVGILKDTYIKYIKDKLNEEKIKLINEKLETYNKLLEYKKIYDTYDNRINIIDEKLEGLTSYEKT